MKQIIGSEQELTNLRSEKKKSNNHGNPYIICVTLVGKVASEFIKICFESFWDNPII